MKKLTTILLLSLSLTGFCKSGTDTTARKEYKLSIFFSPERLAETYRLPVSVGGYNLQRIYFNHTAGVLAQFPLTQRIGLGTGITYSQLDLKETYYCEYCNTGLIETKRLNLRFLEIPVFIHYNFLNSKIKLHAQAGFVGSYLIREPDLYYISFNKMLLKVLLGIGANIDIGNKLNFQLTPTYRHSFNSLFKETNFKIHSFGIIAGLTYRMKK